MRTQTIVVAPVPHWKQDQYEPAGRSSQARNVAAAAAANSTAIAELLPRARAPLGGRVVVVGGEGDGVTGGGDGGEAGKGGLAEGVGETRDDGEGLDDGPGLIGGATVGTGDGAPEGGVAAGEGTEIVGGGTVGAGDGDWASEK
ncbi:hypothetical protein SAY86_026947 [Trapa natans]|uniref:Uncharacterized protein n=1 Tax=Trapa natans TaxID=22666 RepID=A0AAN7QIB2_TRANT|nr:hypothetical protein SAY86_026947 [Trapa natans]